MPVTDREHGRPVGNRNLIEKSPNDNRRRTAVALALAAIGLAVAIAALVVALIALNDVAKLTSAPGGVGGTDIGTTGQ